MTFRLLHSDPAATFQPIAQASALYVYSIQFFVWAASPRSQAIAKCPTGMKRKNIMSNATSKWSFLVKNMT